ncbi:MAG: hypothetical protein ABR583_04385 [Gaiellaceae bacterium]
MRGCPGCGGEVARLYRYCPWCASPLRLKLVEFFRGHEEIDADRALRVSRYLGTDRHVRFSVWVESDVEARAEAVVSLDDDEAARLARFLAGTAPTARRSLLDRLYSSLAR